MFRTAKQSKLELHFNHGGLFEEELKACLLQIVRQICMKLVYIFEIPLSQFAVLT